MAGLENGNYEFGPFHIDTAERVLRRGEAVVALPPKAVDTLLVLLEAEGRVVKKDDLMKRVWPDTFVEEGGLAKNISLLRKALGDGADESNYIETVPKVGYRFIAPAAEPSSRPPETPSILPKPAPWHVTRRQAVILGTIVVLIAVLVAAVSIKTGSGPRNKSLAVLPLENLSNDQSQEYFVDGMTDEIISYLAKIKALRVISRTTSNTFKGVRKPLPQIAKELNVDLIVEGTVLRSGDRVRISAQLIEARTEQHLWAETYEKDLRDVLSLQSEVASAITREVRVQVTPEEQKRLAASRRVNPEAYDAYLKGRYFWNRRSPDSLPRAIEFLQQAITKDPTYALAHSALADAYALPAANPYDVMPPRQAMPRAKEEVAQALQLDNNLAEAHASLAYIKLSYDWDWAGAEAEFRRAIELNPGYATAHHWYSHYFLATGRPEQALAEMKLAQEMDPQSQVINVGLGWCLYQARRYDEAIALYQKTLEMDPKFFLAHFTLGAAYEGSGRHDDSIAEFRKAVDLSGGAVSAVAGLGHAYAVTGRRAEALEQLARLDAVSKQGKYVPALYRAFVYAGLGDNDRAIDWTRKGCEERSDYLIYVNLEPSLENLRADPRFRDLLRTYGLLRP